MTERKLFIQYTLDSNLRYLSETIEFDYVFYLALYLIFILLVSNCKNEDETVCINLDAFVWRNKCRIGSAESNVSMIQLERSVVKFIIKLRRNTTFRMIISR